MAASVAVTLKEDDIPGASFEGKKTSRTQQRCLEVLAEMPGRLMQSAQNIGSAVKKVN